MKKEYFLRLRCATCGREDSFEYSDDKSYVKCTFCNREYFGGIEELKELNEDVIEEVKEEIKSDAKRYLESELKKIFKGNKHIKFK